MAVVFHDIIYDPKAKDNEEKSVEILAKYYSDNANYSEVKQAILDTKTHKASKSKLSKYLCDLDTAVLHSDYETFIDFENKIFKEFQFTPYPIYKEKRLKILENYGVCKEYLNYVKNWKPNIAVYAGSFNPFHKGHYNILQKAEQIFDKVIIAKGINPDKEKEYYPIPEILKYIQVEHYSGLLTNFLKTQGDVTLIRGVRNAADLEFEKTQYRYLQDMDKNIKVMYLFCDSEFEHLSSTAIRQLINKFGVGKNYLTD